MISRVRATTLDEERISIVVVQPEVPRIKRALQGQLRPLSLPVCDATIGRAHPMA
jgi:hypothetical protein